MKPFSKLLLLAALSVPVSAAAQNGISPAPLRTFSSPNPGENCSGDSDSFSALAPNPLAVPVSSAAEKASLIAGRVPDPAAPRRFKPLPPIPRGQHFYTAAAALGIAFLITVILLIFRRKQ